MQYRIVGTYNEEGQWRGAGLIYEGASHRLIFVTPRNHGQVIAGELASLQPADQPLLQGLEITEVRELDRNFGELGPERFFSLLRERPRLPKRRKKPRQKLQIDVRSYQEED